MANSYDIAQSDLAELLNVLGMGDHARPQSPHEVFQEALRVLRARLGKPAPNSTRTGAETGAITEDDLRQFAKSKRWYVREGTSVPQVDGGWRHPFSITADSRDLCELINSLAARLEAPSDAGWEWQTAVDLLREVLPILKLPKDDPNAYAGGTIGRIQGFFAGLKTQEDLASKITAKCRDVDAVLGPDPWKTRKHVGGIYIASKTAHAPRWRQLRADGLPVISTWIDEAGKGETGCFTGLWQRCVDEAASADAVIVYREPGEVLKGAFVEVGAALAVGAPVYAVGCDEFSFVQHAGVTRCADFGQALALALPTPPSDPAPSGQAEG